MQVVKSQRPSQPGQRKGEFICPAGSAKPDIEEEHDHETQGGAERCPVLVARTVCLGNGLVADDIEHRTCGEGNAPRQQGFEMLTIPAPRSPPTGSTRPVRAAMPHARNLE